MFSGKVLFALEKMVLTINNCNLTKLLLLIINAINVCIYVSIFIFFADVWLPFRCFAFLLIKLKLSQLVQIFSF